ncbi:DUF4625 domain-containing protein [Tunicatimonas pelagia]|uniref:DUF4625 domain-containing protein n=1 Tax=Tunicatimonas pelagia TaxID=931531 RepID=UPI002665E4DB|nr:DUF4625 domain-containing protein [Tunicatimonas pelagia]WKN44149.1 DUF4625 domain-containing protein [Tunicatimonas pelagia]
MKYFLLTLFLTAILTACSDNDPDDPSNDLEAPVFSSISRPSTQGDPNVVKIRGEYMEVLPENSSELRLQGELSDNLALSEMQIDIHNSQDGHTHARIEQRLPGLVVQEEVQLNGRSHTIDQTIRYDDRDYLAGPYHVILHAVDAAGNVTSFSDGSSVVRSVYLKRPYMPLIALANDPDETLEQLSGAVGNALSVEGYLEQRRDEHDFAITFIRVSLVQDTDRDSDTDWQGDTSYEAMWGESQFLRDNTGAMLTGPDIPAFTNDQLLFTTLWEGQPYTLTAGDNERVLRIEVEDEGGNLAVREFTILID